MNTWCIEITTANLVVILPIYIIDFSSGPSKLPHSVCEEMIIKKYSST